ncbi:pectin esterase [Caulobacter flavus]|uniref:Pectin esterase n=1 Tax=Caulobacter flavus TaxID=1679497 RepID=A0A2N5CTM3_9CAUL|nr:pectinesterase family protein [Caulobacter flavus]AYV47726.1 pectin esterase [Caulobacter flavus]PLR15399.1 pectin esterase [Caulobacter flavus]
MTMVSRRAVAAGLLLLPGVASAAPRYDAVLKRPDDPRRFAVPTYEKLSAAVAAAPANGTRPFRILVAKGVFDEQVVIDKPFVHLIGESRTGSIVTHLAASGLTAPDGKRWGTFRTPTLFVRAPDFSARNLTIRNAFDGLAEMTRPGGLHSHDGGGPQAVALMLDKGSDRARFTEIDILSYQDTLFPDAGRSLFERCLIAGSYDFIFGAGRTFFRDCEIRSLPRPVDPVDGYVVAPSTPIDQPFGFVFKDCRLTKAAGTARRSVYLGRPWRPSSQFPDGHYGDPRFVGASAFIDCWMDDHVAPEGWTQMWYTGKDGDPRTMLQPEDARFSQYGSKGPGAAAFRRGRALTAAEARAMGVRAVLAGWSV